MFDFDVYALAGDGCMMEGVASEAASLAGHLGLSNLCWIYDSNRVTIEGHTDITFTEDVAARFIAYGWNVTTVADANDTGAVERALQTFRAEAERPTLVLVHSHIGYGSPVRGLAQGARRAVGGRGRAGRQTVPRPARRRRLLRPRRASTTGSPRASAPVAGPPAGAGRRCSSGTAGAYPELADEVEQIQRRDLPEGWDAALPAFPPDPTRDRQPRLVRARCSTRSPRRCRGWWAGRPTCRRRPRPGSPSTEPATSSPASEQGRNLHFGIREHASAAIANGMALTKLRPYWSGFLIFSDYARGAIRLSALMEIPVLHIFTHDSIGVGEDGPTHQPVEQLVSLRAMPGLLVFRPADANEVVETWRIVTALRHEPAALILSRQALPTLDRTVYGPASGVARGGLRAGRGGRQRRRT